METKFSPLLEVRDLLPLTPARLLSLPDIIDIRCGHVGIALYFYPLSSWHWSFDIQKQPVTMNSCTPWFAHYCWEIILPTLHIEYAIL
jgi:hypothetical protein